MRQWQWVSDLAKLHEDGQTSDFLMIGMLVPLAVILTPVVVLGLPFYLLGRLACKAAHAWANRPPTLVQREEVE